LELGGPFSHVTHVTPAVLTMLVIVVNDRPRLTGEMRMTRYRLQVYCNVCGDFHPLSIACSLENGPPKITSVRDIFDGKHVPDWLESVAGSKLKCPATGMRFTPEDEAEIFLVPIND
jgi:hypothetical protein